MRIHTALIAAAALALPMASAQNSPGASQTPDNAAAAECPAELLGRVEERLAPPAPPAARTRKRAADLAG